MDAALKLRRQGNYAPMVFTTVTNDFLAQAAGAGVELDVKLDLPGAPGCRTRISA